MMTPYLFSFNATMGTRQQVLTYLDSLPQVLNWYAVLPEAVIIISRQSSSKLSDLIHQRYPLSYFIIAEIPRDNNNGWLPKTAWDFINNPKSSGRWEP